MVGGPLFLSFGLLWNAVGMCMHVASELCEDLLYCRDDKDANQTQ